MKTLEDTIKYLTDYAEKILSRDDHDFSICDSSGGNIDDAYSIGIDHGEVLFARSILKWINKG